MEKLELALLEEGVASAMPRIGSRGNGSGARMIPPENNELDFESVALPEGIEVDCDLPYVVKVGKRVTTITVDSEEDGGIVVTAIAGLNVHVVRTGGGMGDSVLEGECEGNSTRSGPGGGHSVRKGPGHAFKIGTGAGEAHLNAYVPGEWEAAGKPPPKKPKPPQKGPGMAVVSRHPCTLKRSDRAPNLWELRVDSDEDGDLRVKVTKGFKVLAVLNSTGEGDCAVNVDKGGEAHSVRCGGGPGNSICAGLGFGYALQMESPNGAASRVQGPGASIQTSLTCEYRRIHDERPRFWGFIVDSDEDGSVTADTHRGAEITVVRTGEGDGDCKVTGQGRANAVREHRGDGDAERVGHGDAWRLGPGQGNAKSHGPGHAWRDEHGPGRPIQTGGGGDAIQTTGWERERWEPYVKPDPHAEPERSPGMEF